MKAVVCLLVLCVAVLARAQDLSYESAVYSDAAAPAPFEAAAQDEAVEASFAEESALPTAGEFGKAAADVKTAVKSIKVLFDDRKNRGGNVSPSRAPQPKPVKPISKVTKPKPATKKPASKPARKPAAKPIKRRPIISVKARKPVAKPARKPARKSPVAKALGRKPRGPARRPRAPAPARGFVDTMWHSERHIPKDSPNRDPEMAKLNLALEAVKEDILSTNKQINDERRWVIAVSKIISSYNKKMQRVEAHIIALRKEMKALYRKKKQIENLKLQKALEAKLKEAKAELKTLMNSLKHVAVKQGQLNKSGRDLRNTIAGIQGQLAKLRGQQKGKKACKKGTRFSRKAKKCVSICKSGKIFSAKGKKCVSRCRAGAKWNAKARKCQRSKKAKKSAKKSKKARK